MILIPCLELWEGKVVRLPAHDRENPVVVSDDPLAHARGLMKDGALFLHLIDLDAALNRGSNDEVLRTLADAGVPFQVGGGIRSTERADELLGIGADAVILGTLFYQDPEAARQLVERFGNRVIAALDVFDGEVRVNSRAEGSGHGLKDAVALLAASGVRTVVYHQIDPADADAGPDLEGLDEVLGQEDMTVMTQCTVRTQQELAALLELHEQRQLRGVVVNRAVDGKGLNISKALQAI